MTAEVERRTRRKFEEWLKEKEEAMTTNMEAVRAIGRGFRSYQVLYVKQGWTYDALARKVYDSLADAGFDDEAQAFLDTAGLEKGPRGGIRRMGLTYDPPATALARS